MLGGKPALHRSGGPRPSAPTLHSGGFPGSWATCSFFFLSPGKAPISPELGSGRKDCQLLIPEVTLQKTLLLHGPRVSRQQRQLYAFLNLLVCGRS